MNDPIALSIKSVIDNDNCSGCGACALISNRVEMGLTEEGFLRPTVRESVPGASTRNSSDDDIFRKTCPGIAVSAPDASQLQTHTVFGRYASVWQAWAVDSDVRHAGSSGGVLTALSAWLLETGRTKTIIGSRPSEAHPTRTVPVNIMSKEDAMRSSGSRYAPVSNLVLFNPTSTDNALVAKPCEASAAAQLQDALKVPAHGRPIVLSFFCAGTPSQRATDTLVTHLGVPVDSVRSLRYRGNGWPGDFEVATKDGITTGLSYDESWGEHLGRDVQWRCKFCVDGTGAHSDISVGDYWQSDDRGYPQFAEGAGRSVAIARTSRGHALLTEAAAAGVIYIEPLAVDKVEGVQPLQRVRKQTLAGRLAGRVLAGKRIPAYRGYRLMSASFREPLRTVKAVVGTFSRTRNG